MLRIRRWNSVGGRANEFLELASNSGNWGQGSGDWGSRNSGWDPLFVLPLIRSLLQLIGPHPTLLFLESFRYPLAGEFAMVTDLGWIIRVPGDWGLEVGILAEVHRNCANRRVCQVDLVDSYEHRHQDLSAANPERGPS